MIIPPRRFLSFLAVSTLLLCSALSAFASDDNDAREVRISFVEGDVRLSRGDGKHTDLNKPWEQAQGGELLGRGFAVATGIGRAEIEFENGSTLYLAQNSLLLFTELSTRGDRVVTRMTLPTGTATFSLQPAARESFFIQTPTDKIEITSPDTYFGRMDAYLDATAITPQGEKGERVVQKDLPKLVIPKGHTVFFQGGEIVPQSSPAQTDSSRGQNVLFPFSLAEVEAAVSALEASRLAPRVPSGLDLQSLPGLPAAIPQSPPSQSKELPRSAANRSVAAADWDNWVSSRVQERAAITTAALKASGLSSPIPGLNDLYAQGSFFPCEPYGTCWEPTPEEQQQAPPRQTSQPSAQAPPSNAANTGFQPQLVEWVEHTWGPCDLYNSRNISRVAHSPEELQKLLRQKSWAESHAFNNGYSSACNYDYLQHGSWIPHRHGYALVLPVKAPPVCKTGMHCKPVHPPHPLFVRVAGKVGFVPRHPKDVKGKPPLNLKHGIILSPVTPGEPVRRIAVDSTQKLKVLDKTPREFQRDFATRPLPVSAPEIRAHLMQEATRGHSTIAANHADSHIVYDYKSQKFMMPAVAVAGAKSREVPVGGIASNGRVASFADGHSGRYADSFGRTSAAASYNGGGHKSGASYGGGRSSGSYSSGSSYSGGGGYPASHSSSSSGGSSSHSSGGSSGGGSVSSSSSASSSSASSSGGGSRGRP